MSQPLAETVPRRVRGELGQRKISYAELARRLSTDENWVGRRVNGRVPMTLVDLDRIVAAIGCPVTAVLPEPATAGRAA